jgi:hypothetical protein
MGFETDTNLVSSLLKTLHDLHLLDDYGDWHLTSDRHHYLFFKTPSMIACHCLNGRDILASACVERMTHWYYLDTNSNTVHGPFQDSVNNWVQSKMS